ncbi:dsRBD fold-containing protein [Amycolatopsis sp. NPDC049252]|uniref:dsRBD fold-containing protein n=1 Tax=Amycolatopsis sp. NPDC049252 TaxID=3363933 RepID=UPI00371E8E69
MDQPAETWSFDVAVEHGPNRTRAQLVLRTPEGQEFSGVGLAHRSGPARIAGYLALGRAMSDLTEELVEAATAELEAETGGVWRA